jgi:VWFA-related protein
MGRCATTLFQVGLVLLLAASIWPAGSAQPRPSQAQFRTDVDLLRLDVSVLDRKRQAVRGLSAEDFVVLEDGQPRPIMAFSAVDVPDAGEQAEGWPREVASDVATNQLDIQRVVVIVMDDGMTESDPATATMAKRIARGVIDRLSPNDLAAVVFTFRGQSQNFTRDRRRLLAAAETFRPKSPTVPAPFSAASKPGGMLLMDPPIGCSLPGRPNCLMQTLETVADALEDTPVGRKAVVLISSGVPDRLESPDAIDALRETLRSLQVANVNVYPFDPTGLSAAGIVGPRFDSLQTLADATGGRATLATNAPWQQIPQMFAENSSYYLLGIEPGDQAHDDRVRRLTVRVRKPDVDVRTRTGYYMPKPVHRRSNGPVAPVARLEKALGAVLPSGTLPLDVCVAPFAAPGQKGAALAITAGVRRPVTDRVSVEKLEFRAAAFDEGFKERASHRQTVEVTLRPNAVGLRRVEVQSRLTLAPGRYEVRVAAEAPHGDGGVFLQVDVPNFRKSRFSVSGLVLGQPRNESSDVLADLVPVLPTAMRVFSGAESITAFLRVYQGGKDAPRPVRVRARILDAAGTPASDESSELESARFGINRAADYRLAVPLDHLGSGQYLLVVEVAGVTGSLRRDVRFTVDRR